MNLYTVAPYKVTIGIPVYQAQEYVRNMMLSALGQTFSDIEFLVVDDMGEDGSLSEIEVLQKQHPRGGNIRIIRNEVHRGVGYTRNRIIDEAQGRYLYFLDSDDMIEPNTIKILYEALQSCKAEVAYASYEVIDKVKHTPTQTYQKPDLKLLKEDELAHFAFKNSSVFHVSVCNCLIDLTFLRSIGLRFIDAMFWEDMAFTYELVTKVSRAVLLSDITYHYICRPGSLSHYQDRAQLQKEEIMKNVSTLNYLKEKCKGLRGKNYLPYLCYNLEMSSFYVVCHVLKHYKRILPPITHQELREVMDFPLRLSEVLCLRKRFSSNLGMWLISHLPISIFVPAMKFAGKLKKVI